MGCTADGICFGLGMELAGTGDKRRDLVSANVCAQRNGAKIKHAEQEIEDNLGHRERNADRIQHDQNWKNPISSTFLSISDQNQSSSKKAVQKPQHKGNPLE